MAKPEIQLFNDTEIQKEVVATLQSFIDLKNEKKEVTIEHVLSPIVKKLIDTHGFEFPSQELWSSIKENIPGKQDEKKPNEYHTHDYGTLYKTTITKLLGDIYGVKSKHTKNGNVLIIDPLGFDRVTRFNKTIIKVPEKVKAVNTVKAYRGT